MTTRQQAINLLKALSGTRVREEKITILTVALSYKLLEGQRKGEVK